MNKFVSVFLVVFVLSQTAQGAVIKSKAPIYEATTNAFIRTNQNSMGEISIEYCAEVFTKIDCFTLGDQTSYTPRELNEVLEGLNDKLTQNRNEAARATLLHAVVGIALMTFAFLVFSAAGAIAIPVFLLAFLSAPTGFFLTYYGITMGGIETLSAQRNLTHDSQVFEKALRQFDASNEMTLFIRSDLFEVSKEIDRLLKTRSIRFKHMEMDKAASSQVVVP